MKKLRAFLLVLPLLLSLSGCFYKDPVISSLPAYREKEFYTSGGFQDFTDYAKYRYESDITPFLASSQYFGEVTPSDIAEITQYLDNFEQWVETVGGELQQNYDFDKTVITSGDYYYLTSKHGQPIGESTYQKFDNYSIYFYDTDTHILFYFHSNI